MKPSSPWRGWGFVAFPLAIIFLFTALPTIVGVALSLFEWTGGGWPRFVGLQNYATAFGDRTLGRALINTLLFAAGTVPLTILLAFPLAVAMNAPWFRGRTALRTIFFLPTVISIVAIGLLWRWVLEPSSAGLLNHALTTMGLESLPNQAFEALNVVAGWLHLPQFVAPDARHPEWLAGTPLGLATIIAVSTWRGLGFAIVLYLAALGNVPQASYDAAAVDGAGPWQIMWRITWPSVRPMTFFLLITGLIGALQVFDIIIVMMGQFEQNWTDMLNVYLYREFGRSRLGYAATIGVVLLAATGLVTAAQLALWRRGREAA